VWSRVKRKAPACGLGNSFVGRMHVICIWPLHAYKCTFKTHCIYEPSVASDYISVQYKTHRICTYHMITRRSELWTPGVCLPSLPPSAAANEPNHQILHCSVLSYASCGAVIIPRKNKGKCRQYIFITVICLCHYFSNHGDALYIFYLLL